MTARAGQDLIGTAHAGSGLLSSLGRRPAAHDPSGHDPSGHDTEHTVAARHRVTGTREAADEAATVGTVAAALGWLEPFVSRLPAQPDTTVAPRIELSAPAWALGEASRRMAAVLAPAGRLGPAGTDTFLHMDGGSIRAVVSITLPDARTGETRRGALGTVSLDGGTPAERASQGEALASSLRRAGIEVSVVAAGNGLTAGATGPPRRSRVLEAARRCRLARAAVRRSSGLVVLVGHPLEGLTSRPGRGATNALVRHVHAWLSPDADLTVRLLGSDPFPPGERVPSSRIDLAVPAGESGTTSAEMLRAVVSRLVRRPDPEIIWEHPGAWRVLLPVAEAAGRPVALANLGRLATANLAKSYPGAVTLSTDAAGLAGAARAVLWDGEHVPLRDESIATLVADLRDVATRPGLAPALAAGAATAAVVPSRQAHHYALYPRADELEWVTARGWPAMGARSLRKRLARRRATTRLWRLMDRSGLAVDAPGETTVDAVLAGLAAETGRAGRLQAIFVGRGTGQLALRVRSGDVDVAVRLALTPKSVERLSVHETAQGMVRSREDELRIRVPASVASGWAGQARWVAEEWLQGRSGPGGWAWSSRGRGWSDALGIAARLGEAGATGSTGPGWAASWGGALHRVAPHLADDLLAAMEPVEEAAMPTAWGHGDFWPGNVFLGRGAQAPMVIDWDRASPEMPAGLDAVFSELYRVVVARGCPLGEAAAWLVVHPWPVLDQAPIGGQRWIDWSPEIRRGLVTASFVRNSSGGSADPYEWNEGWVARNVWPLVAALRLAGEGHAAGPR